MSALHRMITNNASSSEPISRKLLFSTPERSNPKLSPDGKYLSFLAPSAKGVRNVWVQDNTVEGAAPFQATFNEGSGVSGLLAFLLYFVSSLNIYHV